MPGAVYFNSHEHLQRRRKGNILEPGRFLFFHCENLMTVHSDGSLHPPWLGGGKGQTWAGICTTHSASLMYQGVRERPQVVHL